MPPFNNSEYHNEITRQMDILATIPNSIFIGQLINKNTGNFYGTLRNVPDIKRKELGVCEELQMGLCIGLSLEGFLPISIYQRMDFLPRAADQIINHLDKIKELSNGLFFPRVIIRTTIGTNNPLNVGLQHSGDLTEGFQKLVKFPVIKVTTVEEVKNTYELARNINSSIMIIEMQSLYTN